MAGLILIVDDLSLNRTVLRGKLTSACYRTETANNGVAALKLVHECRPDLVLLDYHMPEMDGLAVCKAMRADPSTRDIPIILFSANSDHHHRLSALAAGADDFMAKPLDEKYLLGRIRSLLRSAASRDKWRDHPNTALQTGFAEIQQEFVNNPGIAIVTGLADRTANWLSRLTSLWPQATAFEISVAEALGQGAPRPSPDLFVITPEALAQAGLHIIAELRSRIPTRDAEICLMLPPTACADAAMALDLGASDILPLPLDRAETRLRLQRVISHKLRNDAQRRALENQLGLAAFDPLTGLHNRSHALTRISRLAGPGQTDMALLMIDLDHFKEINDRYGHNVGDTILQQVAQRMRQDLRHDDILCRYGGEEFLLVLPKTDLATAQRIAKRLCHCISDRPYVLSTQSQPLHVTASIGISIHSSSAIQVADLSLKRLIEQSDNALRNAKRSGRNRVFTAEKAIA